jgi:hypothetical protein
MQEFEHAIGTFFSMLPRVALVTALAVCGAILLVAFVVLAVRLLNMCHLLRQEAAFLELTPPANSDKASLANDQLFAVLHGLEETRQALDKALGRSAVFTPEVASTYEGGIRYLIRVPKKDKHAFEKHAASYLPDAKLKEVEDYLPDESSLREARVLSFRLTGHFAYPLKQYDVLTKIDPDTYLTGALANLTPGELVAIQHVLSPAKIRHAHKLGHKVLHNEAHVSDLGKQRRVFSIRPVLNGINEVLFAVTDGIGEMTSGPSQHSSQLHRGNAQNQQQAAMKLQPARTLSRIEQDLAESVYDKLGQQLFRVSIRVVVVTKNRQRSAAIANDIRQSFLSFQVPRYQSLRARSNFPYKLKGVLRAYQLKHRLPALFNRNACILSASEVAGLYHFPHATAARTDNVIKSMSKTLAAPVALKNGTKLDVVLGRNYHHGVTTDIGLTAEERERHVFIVGGTGNGKTTLMKYAIVQDIQSGKGVAVIDPHGDLAQELLAYIPRERVNDVIYFNPSDLGYPIGLNLLEVPEGLTGDELLDAKDFIAETVVSIMRKTFSDNGTGGHRIEYVLRNTVLTALTVKDATLFTVYDLLTNSTFRKPIVDKLEQQWLKNFWRNEFSRAGDYQQVKMMSGVTSKIGRYHASVSAERILSQPKSTINFDEILDGKILICNLAKGLVGEDTSEVLGISILAKLQLASFRRIKQQRTERRPFYAYVDEFQNFATVSFVEMLSEARKYKLFLTMAEQTTSQQSDQKMVNTILTNAGTIIGFKSNSLADEKQLLHLFNGRVDPGEIANLSAYHFYAKLSGGLEPLEPVSGTTIVLDGAGSEGIAEAVVAASRANYAKKWVAKRLSTGDGSGSGGAVKNAGLGQAKDDADEGSELPAGSEKVPEKQLIRLAK